jgi:hypothetical protein
MIGESVNAGLALSASNRDLCSRNSLKFSFISITNLNGGEQPDLPQS